MTIPGYSVEEVGPSEVASIAALWCANFDGYDDAGARAKLRAAYADNPVADSTLLALRATTVAGAQGTIGLCARAFRFGERAITMATACDFVVDARHRSLGPAMQLLRAGARIAAERFDLCYALPNANAAPVFRAAGFRELGSFDRYAKPLRTRRLLAKRLPAVLAALAAPFVDFALAVRDRVHGFGTDRLECHDTAWTASEIDALFAQRPGSLLLSVRSARMLRWRFEGTQRGADDDVWQLAICRDRGGVIRGYAVWRIVGGKFEIGDLFAADPQRWTWPLVAALTQRARAEKAASSLSFSCLAPAALASQLRAAGLTLRPDRRPVYIARSAEADAMPAEAWYLTEFDEDTS